MDYKSRPEIHLQLQRRPSKSFSFLLLAVLLSSIIPAAFVVRVASAQALSVTVLSPSAGMVFNRGETATITAAVSSAGSPVSGASVTVNSPTGAGIILAETSTLGTYSAQYSVLSADPLGTWSMSVQALKSGQVASGSVSVSISGALRVAVLTPLASAKFNIGEVVTVKASVAFQDNSPVSGSASVTFNKPMAGSAAMTPDASDSSGRTWTGSYTVQSADIPADGFTWSITVSASFNGNTGSSVQNVNLFRTLRVQAATFSSSTFATAKDNFAIGETVFVEGVFSLQDSMLVSSGVATFTISGTSIASSQ